MLDILAITGPIYLCIAAGYASVRWNLFTKADMRVFGKFVIQIALPALLFNALASRPLGEVVHTGYLLAFTAGSLALIGGALWFARSVQRKSLTESAYVAMGMTCSNSGYVGYPVMLLLFGPLGGVILALNLIVENLIKLPLLFTLADAGAHEGERPSLLQALKQTGERLVRNPMIVAIFAGFVVALLGWQLPAVITRTVTLFSAASSGMALFIIGNLVAALAPSYGMLLVGRVLSAWWFAAWGFDWIYDKLFVKPYLFICRLLGNDPLNSTMGVLPSLARGGHHLVARAQTGNLRWYAYSMVAGAVLLLGIALLAAA